MPLLPGARPSRMQGCLGSTARQVGVGCPASTARQVGVGRLGSTARQVEVGCSSVAAVRRRGARGGCCEFCGCPDFVGATHLLWVLHPVRVQVDEGEWNVMEKLGDGRYRRQGAGGKGRIDRCGVPAVGAALQQLPTRSQQPAFSCTGRARLGCGIPFQAVLCDGLGPPAPTWDRLGPPAPTWDRLGPPGTAWDSLHPLGTAWDRLGQPAPTWDRLGPPAPTWDRLGPPAPT